MPASDVVLLNDFSTVRTDARTSSTGKVSVSLKITSEPIAVNLDPGMQAALGAKALASVLRKQIRAITAGASHATVSQRETDKRAFGKGKAWAVKRWSGGQMGATPPGQSDKAFNSSGRLASGIVAIASKSEPGTWHIKGPANRFDPADFAGGEAGPQFQAMVRKLVNLVPALREPLREAEVVEAVRDGMRKSVSVGRMAEAGRRGDAAVARLLAEALRTAAEVLAA